MKNYKYIFIAIFTLICASKTSAQSDCSNPTPVIICPTAIFTGQTNSGMGDNAPAPCNIPGEDLLYEINVTNGSAKLHMSVINATAPMYLSLQEVNCGTSNCSSTFIPSGNINLSFNVTQNVTYFVWIDSDTTVFFDIEFGADTGKVWVNIPNTMGNLQFDSSPCDTPVFHASKPYFNVTYNTVYQTDPMTLSPLFTVGTMCIATHFKNTTGDEGIKKFEFTFNPNGFSSVVTTDSIPGFYNAGYWIASNIGNIWRLIFYDTAGLGKGDFTGSPDSCLRYEFCFDIIPVSNQPELTNVEALIYGDGFGAGFSGYVKAGCCPSPFPNCLGFTGGGGVGGTGVSTFGYGFDDPANPLPIELLSFNAEIQDSWIYLTWITATEKNNDYFTVQKSQSGFDWKNVLVVDGSGNSSMPVLYKAIDKDPFPGISYYRLKQTDFDGKYSYSEVIKVNVTEGNEFDVYPNPSEGTIIIRYYSIEKYDYRITIKDATGKLILTDSGILKKGTNLINIDIGNYNKGVYFIELLNNDKVNHSRIILR